MKDAIDPYDQVIQIYAFLNIKGNFISYLSSAKYIQYMFVSIIFAFIPLLSYSWQGNLMICFKF